MPRCHSTVFHSREALCCGWPAPSVRAADMAAGRPNGLLLLDAGGRGRGAVGARASVPPPASRAAPHAPARPAWPAPTLAAPEPRSSGAGRKVKERLPAATGPLGPCRCLSRVSTLSLACSRPRRRGNGDLCLFWALGL